MIPSWRSRGCRMFCWLATLLALIACGEAPSEDHIVIEPAVLEYADGSELAQITLTEQAIARLGLQTAEVARAGSFVVVPAGALIVDPDGGFWVYTRLGARMYGRQPIRIDHQEGDLAYLSERPASGTEVVVVGAAELYGVESGIGH